MTGPDPRGVTGPETPPAARVPWGVLDCVGVVAATVVAVVAVVNVLALLGAVVGLLEQLQVLLLPLPLATLGLVTVAWVHVRHRAVGRLGGPARAGPGGWLLGLALGVGGFLVVNVGLGVLVQVGATLFDLDVPEPQPGVRQAALDPELLPWLVLSAVVIAPVAEELFFRGMLHQALRRRTGAWPAILVSAVVFGAAHVVAEPTLAGGALVFVLVLPLGVLLGWLFERRGSLGTVIALHAAFNAVTLAVMWLAVAEGVMAGG